MKKIVVEKTEGIAEVIDRILGVSDEEILLIIPKGSALGKSASNFRLLKREADEAEKKIIIESVDEAILDFAKENKIENAHAFLKAGQHTTHAGVGVSDIVARAADDEEDIARNRKKGPAVKLTIPSDSDSSDSEDEDSRDAEDQDSKEEAEGKAGFFGDGRFFKPRTVSVESGRHVDDDEEDEEEGAKRGISGKSIAWGIGIVVILGIAFYIVTATLGHAQVTIDFTQTPWNYQGSFIADKAASSISASGNTIPAQVFTTQKNITQLFPATGAAATVSTKAQGTITIYNNYSAAPQDLVATTRFLTPDGKIFRITQDVTVPGATASGTGFAPSSVTAPIIADQGGPAYNVGPVNKLTIPGFQSNPGKEAGFYGVITGQTSGGFTGTKQVPTAADIASAKTKTTAVLQSDLQDGLSASYPNNFKILDGATNIQITKLTVNTSTDANGNFSVFGEATLQAIGFDQSALETYLLSQSSPAIGGGTTLTFKDISLTYSNVQANFTKGQVSFSLSGTGSIEPAFDPNSFASSVAGKSISDARTVVGNLPDLSDGKISVWPVWLWSMPSNPSKISVTAN